MKLLSEFWRVRDRYIARHTKYRFSTMALSSSGGDPVGYLEEFAFSNDRLWLRGWTISHQLVLETDGARHSVPRRVQRGDVMAALGPRMLATGNQHGCVGFDISVPWTGKPIHLTAEDLSHGGPWELPLPTDAMIRAEHRRVQIALWRDLSAALPTALRYLLLGRRRADRDLLHKQMGFHKEPNASLPLNPRFLAPGPVPTYDFPATTIIMPVYNAFELLSEALDRVDRHTDVPWHLVLVEDASPDERVRPWLRDWAAARAGRVTLLLNDRNLGFVGSVNRGLDLAARRGGPVVLLNSDALVPEGWASRLLRPMLADPRVASVTPMSNDATILTVPWIAGRVVLEPGAADRIDATARRLSPQAQAQIPTGVGFCMVMSRAALDRVPALDTAFGRGYGEEVDWCRKTAAAGMVHVGLGSLFVEHRGGESFGSAAKAAAVERSARIISTRYPEFDDEVRRFIAADPLVTARLILALIWAAGVDPDPIHVYLGHSLGGGAEHWLAARIAERAREGRPTVVIRVGGARRFGIELHSDSGVLTGETDEVWLLRNLVQTMPRRRIVYSCGVGDDCPWELPRLLCDLASGEGSTLEILFHDYFPISPSLNLLNADGSYTEVPPANSTDPAHQISSAEVCVPLSSWRERWSAAVQEAEQLTVFSNSSAEIVRSAWPEAGSKILCQPHQALIDMPLLERPKNEGPGVLGVLGAIGAVKGAQVVSDLAFYLDRQPNAPQLVIVGEFDHSFPLPPSVRVTGRYDPVMLPKMLSSHGITAWLMPSIWPETFSFTTHEMLATGLPVMAFDLGAQGEAVRQAPNGHIVAPDPAAILDCFRRLQDQNRE